MSGSRKFTAWAKRNRVVSRRWPGRYLILVAVPLVLCGTRGVCAETAPESPADAGTAVDSHAPEISKGDAAPVTEPFEEAPPPSIGLAGPVTPASDTPAAVPEYFKAHQAIWAEDATPAAIPPVSPAGTPERAIGASLGQDVLQWLVYLFFICGFIILAGYLIKRLGRRSRLLAGLQYGEVLGRLYLAPRVSLHFVKTGGRVLVVGVTQSNLSLLTEFDAEAFEAALQETSSEAPPESDAGGFVAQLRASALKETGTSAADDDLAALRGDIQRLQQHLQKGGRESRE